ncbi:MAG TPA: ABC transporter ATP-binding protein [Ideonella sp.]|nr:ABC transporter ATP-binding protein [Ideonella sp.]
MSKSPAVLLVSDVTVRFQGIVALDGVSFKVSRGEIVGIIGPNGAGKSTLFNAITGLCARERGHIAFDGVPLKAMPSDAIARLGVGRTFQNLALFESMSVLDHVRVGQHSRRRGGFLAQALGLPSVVDEERAAAELCAALLKLLQLDGVAASPVATLPFATRKRVDLARALAGEPRLLLLDEPAGGLSEHEAALFERLIRDIRQRMGVTVLLVEHQMSLVVRLCDRVIALDFGRKIAEGTPSEVSRDAEVVRAYLGTAA